MFFYNKRRLLFKFAVINFLLILCLYFCLEYVDFLIDYSSLAILVGLFLVLVVNIVLLKKFFLDPLLTVCAQVSALLSGAKYQKLAISTKDEFGLLSMFFNQITDNVEKVSTYLKEGSRMASELSLARDIQKSVLPVSLPEVPGLDIVSKTRPAEEVGGDSFDIEYNNEEYYFYIGDVTGHGAPAGLVMMMVNTLFDVYVKTVKNTKDLAVQINKTLKPRVNSTLFMTTSFFRWSPVESKIFYTGCGHENIIIYRANEGIAEVFPAGGIALAMAEDIENIVSEKEIVLNEHDMIVLYSDGITEAVSVSGELFGLERLRSSVNKNGHLASSMLLFEAISKDVQDFVGDTLQRDDMTLFIIKKTFSGLSSNSYSESSLSTKWINE